MHCFIALEFDNNCIELHCNVVLRCRRNISAVHYILTAIALNCIKKLQCHPVLHRRRQGELDFTSIKITKRREVKGNVSVCLFESNIFVSERQSYLGPTWTRVTLETRVQRPILVALNFITLHRNVFLERWSASLQERYEDNGGSAPEPKWKLRAVTIIINIVFVIITIININIDSVGVITSVDFDDGTFHRWTNGAQPALGILGPRQLVHCCSIFLCCLDGEI